MEMMIHENIDRILFLEECCKRKIAIYVYIVYVYELIHR